MTARIDAHDLVLRYGDTTALDGLTFSIEGPGIFGLIGRNGSGKTSLLSVLAGFRRASGGTVQVDGQQVFENPAMMRRVSLIREGGDTVNGSEKVGGALQFAARMRPQWDDNYAASLLDRFNVPPDKKVGHLSRGQGASLAVTLGLASRAPLTMFDEAYLGMDAPSRYVFYEELLQDFMAHPRTFILSTHLIEEVSSLFEEVLILHEGRLLLHDDAESFRSHGATVTGPRDVVERFVNGMRVLDQRHLGPTASAVIYGELGQGIRREAANAGLELGAIPLQDLFVHLTAPKEDSHDR